MDMMMDDIVERYTEYGHDEIMLENYMEEEEG